MNILKIEKLSKFFGGVKAVNNISFDIKKNTISSLIGPNGAGKTTVFNLVTKILQKNQGQIFFKNNNIEKLKTFQLINNGISRTFQNVVLYPNMSLIENVMLGAHYKTNTSILKYLFRFKKSKIEDKKIYDDAIKWLEFVGLKDKINSEISELAFGQQRLAEIARVLISEPSLLLLDEPAAGLNPKETEDLSKLLLKIKNMNKTIFLVEHDMNLVMNISDKIIVMNFGELLAQGNPEEILKNKDVISAYLGDA